MAWASSRGWGDFRSRPRVRGRGRNFGSPRQSTMPTADLGKLFENLNSEPTKTWTVKAIADLVKESGNRPYHITARSQVASYNWDKEASSPVIVVPGAPKEFLEWEGGNLSGWFGEEREVKQDQNLDALLTAVRVMDPTFKVSDYDIICDLDTIVGFFYICLQVVNTIRASSGHVPVGDFKIGHDEIKLRIDAQMVGGTLLLVRQQVQFLEPAGGVGLKFRRVCTKLPPCSMMRGEQLLDSGLIGGLFESVQSITMGSLKILMKDEVDGARYPSEDSGPTKTLGAAFDADVNVTIGGYKGDLNTLTPIALASRSIQAGTLHPGKWLKQYLNGYPYRYVGLHDWCVFNDQPSLKTLDEVRVMCGFDNSAADLWLKVLERVLDELVVCARNYDFGMPDDADAGQKFALIVDPENRQLSVHEYDTGAAYGGKTDVVSAKTLNYLMSTLK